MYFGDCVFNLCVRQCLISRSESSKPHPERSAIAEHFCWGNTLLLLIKLEKLIQISVFISVRPLQRWEVCYKSNIWVWVRTFWMTLVYSSSVEETSSNISKMKWLVRINWYKMSSKHRQWEWEQSIPVDWIKGLVWNSQKVINYDRHMQKARGYFGQNIMIVITTKINTPIQVH